MYVEPCPRCGRTPKIEEWCRDKYGNRRWFIGCPNYCWVIKSQIQSCVFDGDYGIRYTGNADMDHGVRYTGNADRNTLYKLWNKAIKESKDAQV